MTGKLLAWMNSLLLAIAVFCAPSPGYAQEGGSARLENRVRNLEIQMQQMTEQNSEALDLMQQLQDQNKQMLALMGKLSGTAPKETASVSTRNTTTNTTTSPQAARYTPGWRARIISVPWDLDITDKLPPLEVASFVADKPGYGMYDYLKIIPQAPDVDWALWKGEAFLDAKEAGNYVFSISTTSGDKFHRAIFVEGNLIAASKDQYSNSLIGAAELEPGLYRVEFRVLVLANYGGSRSIGSRAGFSVQVKGPSDNQGRPISEVLLVRK
ncbi:MAG: hypothetical protein LBV79_07560 [Candidatus Adiutrix sp.]|nr:hypothetical protein [Candidatus Adiutrix sp.]